MSKLNNILKRFVPYKRDVEYDLQGEKDDDSGQYERAVWTTDIYTVRLVEIIGALEHRA